MGLIDARGIAVYFLKPNDRGVALLENLGDSRRISSAIRSLWKRSFIARKPSAR